MAKGEKIDQSQFDLFLGRAKDKVQKKVGSTAIETQTVADRVATESGGKDANGFITDPGRNSKAKDGQSAATGIAQMFPPAVAEAHKLLYGGDVLSGAALEKVYKEVTDSPEKSILYSFAFHAALEQQARGILRKLGITVNDDTAIRTIVSAAYHLGFGNRTKTPPIYTGVEDLIRKAADPKPFSVSKFVQLYEEQAASIGELNSATRKTAGIGGSPTVVNGAAQRTVREVDMGQDSAPPSDYIPLSFDVANSVPSLPQTVIEDGTNNLAWSEKDPTKGGGLVGNPHLRQLDPPAWFELRLNKVNGDSLVDAQGMPLKFKLNVSLAAVNTKSQHVVNREPTATGLLITFWGSQPDSIVGRGTTGVFLNTFGLTSFMSTKGSLESNGLDTHLEEVFSQSPQVWAKILQEEEKLRVAAQDAFMEFTALFKNNGVIRFLPKWYLAGNSNRAGGRSSFQDQQVWSPTAGASGFQMLNRAGDTYTRGHVAFRYKGTTYLGYFKSLEFTADAKSPFKWDFSFTFRVLRSLSPVFKYRETANG